MLFEDGVTDCGDPSMYKLDDPPLAGEKELFVLAGRLDPTGAQANEEKVKENIREADKMIRNAHAFCKACTTA